MSQYLKKLTVRFASTAGLNAHNRLLLETIQRPQWIYRAGQSIPYFKLYFEQPENSAEGITLCKRLIAAYEYASGSSVPSGTLDVSKTEGIWSAIINAHYSPLLSALNQKNAEELAKLLGAMFQQKFMLGIASGVLHATGHNRLSEKLWSLKYINSLVSLAEFLGLERAECPEQGVIGYAVRDGVDKLISRIEQKLERSIDVPRIGAPHGIEVAGTLVTSDSPEHIYVAARASQLIDLFLDSDQSNCPKVVEIGAGYGGTAYWLLQLNRKISSYTIIDLPLVNVLQGYYLSKSLGEDQVSLYGEDRKKIAVLPTHAIGVSYDAPFDLLLNENSMPEMPENAIAKYLAWAASNCRGLFYSYNQEAYSCFDGVPQILVPEVVQLIGGYQLLTRSPSWLRRGYVEEVYRCPKAAARWPSKASQQN
ncbi:MAG: putative sugar O-methyltransferase [Pyrinomonadaceae bacterium]